MEIPKFKLGSSIFSRLIVTFLIIIIPIYMLGIYINSWSLYTVKNEISKSTAAQVSFYLEGLEKEIERIKILQYDCLNDEYLNKLAIRWNIMNMYERVESLRQLQQRLVTIKNSSIYIKNVNAYIFPAGRTVSSNTGIDNIDMEGYREIRVPADIKGAQIINFKGGLYLSTLQQKNISNTSPLYLIAIELNQDALEQALAQFNTLEGSGSILINLTDNGIIMNKSDAADTLSIDSVLDNLDKNGSSGMVFNKTEHTKNYIVYAKSNYLNMILLKYIPEEFILKPLWSYYIWVWVFSIVSVCIILIYSFSTYKFMHKPLATLVKAFRKVESGDLQVSINHDSNNEFGYLYKRFNNMTRNLNTLIDQVYNQKILMQRAELKQLQSQINPHFLYNSFFMINTMAKVGDENLIPFTKHLGEYFRFVTRNSSDYIPLSDEVNHAGVYTSIQLMRFSKRVQIQFAQCPEMYSDLKVPRLILQPIIENAFEHGIEKKKNGGIIRINFEADEKGLNIIVEDNGDEMADARLSELQKALEYSREDTQITGIININRRIKLVFGEKSGLYVFRSELGGLKVILKIKISGGDDHAQIADCG
ncbi:histidine kinase [Anaerobacterium chartisolvens]|uniref:histidine kinase n=1 Tax=Anaerobacterium chartisolvens TaxID=1297424 RepID=UPI001FA84DD1|nr:histidine kinase [Anaerobacterium chartisolvens]